MRPCAEGGRCRRYGVRMREEKDDGTGRPASRIVTGDRTAHGPARPAGPVRLVLARRFSDHPSGRGFSGLSDPRDLRRTAHNGRRAAENAPRSPLLTRTKYPTPRRVKAAGPVRGRAAPHLRGSRARTEPYGGGRSPVLLSGEPVAGVRGGRRRVAMSTVVVGGWASRARQDKETGGRRGRPRIRPTAAGTTGIRLPGPGRRADVGRNRSGRWSS